MNSGAPKRILIVEDEYILFEELHSLFSHQGYVVNDFLDNFEEAIAEAHIFLPDLALLDIELNLEKGSEDGIALAKRLKMELGIPIIFLSANFDPLTLKRIAAIQEHHLLIKPKPLDHTQLLASVQLALRTATSKRSARTLPMIPAGLKVEINKGQEHYVSFENVVMIQTNKDDPDAVWIRLEHPIQLPIPWEERDASGAVTRLEDQVKRRISLKKLMEGHLPPHFIQTQKDCIVNGHKITGIDGSQINLGEFIATVSRTYLDGVREFVGKRFR